MNMFLQRESLRKTWMKSEETKVLTITPVATFYKTEERKKDYGKDLIPASEPINLDPIEVIVE